MSAAERASEASRAMQKGWSKLTSERCEGTIERMSEWPSNFVLILSYSSPQWFVGLAKLIVTPLGLRDCMTAYFIENTVNIKCYRGVFQTFAL